MAQFKHFLLYLFPLSMLTGCPWDSGSSHETSLSSFNLTDIEVTNSSGTSGRIGTANFTWTSAEDEENDDEDNINYSVCQKDTTETDNCDSLTSVTNSLTASNIEVGALNAYLNSYFILANADDETEASNEKDFASDDITSLIGYIKASNAEASDVFGTMVALSGDGKTLAVSASQEKSAATGVNGDDTDNSISNAGAVYVYRNVNGSWYKQAYLKSSSPTATDYFGNDIAISDDGNTLAVGVFYEDSNATGIDGDATDNSSSNSGAVYIFKYSGSAWVQSAYLKASNTSASAEFGRNIAISGDGNTVAVGSYREDTTATDSGAVYIFRYSSGWTQEALLKASTAEASDHFGMSMSLSYNGNVVAIGAQDEDSSATGIDGDESDNSASSSGAVYVFKYSSSWTQNAFIKASNSEAGDYFGTFVSLSSDGNTLAVGANGEDSSSTTIDANSSDNTLSASGAVYVFRYSSGWTQQSYIKPTTLSSNDAFGSAVRLSSSGNILAVTSTGEDSDATGIGGDGTNDNASGSGAVYLFKYSDSAWSQNAYIKASNTEASDAFGSSISLDSDGSRLAVGSRGEDSQATNINGDQTDNTYSSAGAVYLY